MAPDVHPTNDPALAARWLEQLDRAANVVRTPCGEGTMTWRRWGDVGRPLVLVHGGGGSWQHWVRNIGPWSRRRRVWCPDLPSFADSSKAPPPAGIDEIAAVVAAGLDVLLDDGETIDLVGFSFGGVVSALVARQRRRLVRHLVIVGATALGIRMPELPMIAWRGEPEGAPRRAAHLHNLHVLMLSTRDDDALAYLVHSANVERARFNGRDTARSTRLRDALADIAGPVTGIWGSRDATAQPDVHAAERAMRSTKPSLRFEVLDGVGHWAPYEAAGRFDALLAQVLET